jgi:membrane dipeptidase
MSKDQATILHEESIVIDAVCPLVMDEPGYLSWYRQGGVTVVAPTVGGWEDAQTTLGRLGSWHRVLRERDDLLLVQSAGAVRAAKRSSRLGIFFHLQGTDPIEGNLDYIESYKTLGVGVVQLTYNIRNRVGDGCEERSDAGLSRFGVQLVERLNRTRIIVDCSHTGNRTSLDAIERSQAPVILSHSNAASIHPSPRNVSDELIKAIAQSGGVIGIVGFPAMVANTTRPSLNDLIAHIDAVVEVAGIDHVGLGLDYYWGQAGVASDEEATRCFEAAVRAGRWSSAYPAPPHHYPAEIDVPSKLPNLTHGLLERGYREADIRKILGENWIRVMEAIWG